MQKQLKLDWDNVSHISEEELFSVFNDFVAFEKKMI